LAQKFDFLHPSLSFLGVIAVEIVTSDISVVQSHADIGIFVISTFDTDYLFVKENDFQVALTALRAAGHEVMT
jgi:hypothetical protein